MKLTDALAILNITTDYDPAIIKAAYRKACMLYHPDRNPAGLEMMKMINQAYDAIKNESGESIESNDYSAEIHEALNKIMHLNLDIEVCGAWIWLHGDTMPHKDLIKASGFKWAPKKKLWYYRPSDYKSYSRGGVSMDDIRKKHGSQKVTMKDRCKLKAA